MYTRDSDVDKRKLQHTLVLDWWQQLQGPAFCLASKSGAVIWQHRQCRFVLHTSTHNLYTESGAPLAHDTHQYLGRSSKVPPTLPEMFTGHYTTTCMHIKWRLAPVHHSSHGGCAHYMYMYTYMARLAARRDRLIHVRKDMRSAGARDWSSIDVTRWFMNEH